MHYMGVRHAGGEANFVREVEGKRHGRWEECQNLVSKAGGTENVIREAGSAPRVPSLLGSRSSKSA